jgi:hypothetical protein
VRGARRNPRPYRDSRVCIATIQTMMVYTIVFGVPRQLQSLAGLEHGRTILLADTARNIGFICPRSARIVAADNPMLAPSASLCMVPAFASFYRQAVRLIPKNSDSGGERLDKDQRKSFQCRLSKRAPKPPNGENHMSKKAAEHHKRAAEHLTLAAHHHGEAAKHYEAGAHEKAAHHAHIAGGHAILARGHAEEAVKAHVEEHGKK